MEILETNKRKSALWRTMAVSVFVFSLTLTYVVQLTGNGSFKNSELYDELNTKVHTDSTLWQLEKENWLAQEEELKNNIRDCELAKDEDNGLKDCQEDLQVIKTAVERHDGYLDELDITIVSLKADLKACKASKNL